MGTFHPRSDRTILTTGQVAKICKVATRTVSKWVDRKLLPGSYRIPGGEDRRIPRDALLHFMKLHNMPTHELEDEILTRILLFTTNDSFTTRFQGALGAEAFFVDRATSNFDAGIKAKEWHHDCVAVDFDSDHAAATTIAACVRKDTTFTDTVLIAVHSDNTPAFDRSIFDETFRRPFDAALLAARAITLIQGKAA